MAMDIGDTLIWITDFGLIRYIGNVQILIVHFNVLI